MPSVCPNVPCSHREGVRCVTETAQVLWLWLLSSCWARPLLHSRFPSVCWGQSHLRSARSAVQVKTRMFREVTAAAISWAVAGYGPVWERLWRPQWSLIDVSRGGCCPYSATYSPCTGSKLLYPMCQMGTRAVGLLQPPNLSPELGPPSRAASYSSCAGT